MMKYTLLLKFVLQIVHIVKNVQKYNNKLQISLMITKMILELELLVAE